MKVDQPGQTSISKGNPERGRGSFFLCSTVTTFWCCLLVGAVKIIERRSNANQTRLACQVCQVQLVFFQFQMSIQCLRNQIKRSKKKALYLGLPSCFGRNNNRASLWLEINDLSPICFATAVFYLFVLLSVPSLPPSLPMKPACLLTFSQSPPCVLLLYCDCSRHPLYVPFLVF